MDSTVENENFLGYMKLTSTTQIMLRDDERLYNDRHTMLVIR